MKASELAAKLGGTLEGADVELSACGGLEEARPGDLSFCKDPKHVKLVETTKASCVLLPPDWTHGAPCAIIRVADPNHACMKAAEFFAPPAPVRAPGVHPTAVVDPSVRLGAGIHVGAYTVIEKNAVIGDGCVIIGQHADSTGAPSACEAALNAGTTVYSVGYNIDMLTAAPNAALVSPTNEWGVYYTYAIGAHMKGEKIETNWAEGFSEDAVALTKLGPNVAPGTQEKVDEVIAQLKEGKLHVFDTSTFTVKGEKVTSAFATDSDGDWVNDTDEAIIDGYYHESYFQSAPSFILRIDGITELNASN